MRTRIDANDKLWKTFLDSAMRSRGEVELINIDEEEVGDYCRAVAEKHLMVFTVDPVTGYGVFTSHRPE